MGILQNYITLEEGRTEVLHFKGHDLVDQEITDPLTQRAKRVRALLLYVDERGGAVVDTILSVLSDKLASHFEPFLEGKRYTSYTFAITKRGSGFRTEWEIQASPRG